MKTPDKTASPSPDRPDPSSTARLELLSPAELRGHLFDPLSTANPVDYQMILFGVTREQAREQWARFSSSHPDHEKVLKKDRKDSLKRKSQAR